MSDEEKLIEEFSDNLNMILSRLKFLEEKVDELEDEKRNNKTPIADRKWELQLFTGSGLVGESSQGKTKLLIDKIIKMRETNFEDYSIKSVARHYMKLYGFSQDELADTIGVTRSTIQNILNGKGISLENAYKLSILFEVPIHELFSYTKE